MSKIVCTICTEVISFNWEDVDPARPNRQMLSTTCGHVFHHCCFMQWYEGAGNCATCRLKLRRDQIHRLFLEVASNEVAADDVAVMEERLESAKFQINVKDEEISGLKKESNKYRKQWLLLKKDYLKLEQCETLANALKEQVKYLKKENESCQQYKEEAQQLKSELNNYKNVKRLLTVGNDKGESMIRDTEDAKSLQVYLIAVKRQLDLAISRRDEFKKTINDLRKERDNLAADLKKKISAWEESERIRNEENERLRNESFRRPGEDSVICIDDQLPKETANDRKNRTIALPSDSEEENLPTFRFNSQKELKRKIPRLAASISANSILLKKPRIAHNLLARPVSMEDDPRMTSDGLGGYKKVDSFPVSSGVKSKVVLPKQSRKLFK